MIERYDYDPDPFDITVLCDDGEEIVLHMTTTEEEHIFCEAKRRGYRPVEVVKVEPLAAP